MEILHRRCAGLDVHQKEIVACRRIASGRKVEAELARFPTTTPGLLALSAWLMEAKVTHVAMEATGVYWKPVWHVLCADFKLILANASHIRNVPGRKSDANDATWIADLLAHGLIRASFVPPQPIQELRELTRTRRELTREIVRHTQRIQATLEEANIKLTSVISDILGWSGRRILKAIVAGESDPLRLAELGHPRLACARENLVAALQGRLRDHHRFLILHHRVQTTGFQPVSFQHQNSVRRPSHTTPAWESLGGGEFPIVHVSLSDRVQPERLFQDGAATYASFSRRVSGLSVRRPEPTGF
jgi:transposase